MTSEGSTFPAPRLLARAGAPTRWCGAAATGVTARLPWLVTLAGTLCLASPAAAQEPPDTVVVDSLAVPDSLSVSDSLTAVDQEADTLSADTIFYNMPSVRSRTPDGFVTGVWSWDRHAIMSSGANTLAELVQEVPGVITLLGGDYGAPLAMSAFGQGGAGYRIIRDGLEVYAVDGGVVDLQGIGLAGISGVRLDRSMGQMVVEMWSHEYEEGRSFSIIEAGTGDLDTNMFRGVYADPRALLGSIGIGLERLDTRGRGPGQTEGGSRTGTWARYQLHLKDRAAIGVDYRGTSRRTNVEEYAPESARSDLSVKGGWRVMDGVVLEGWTGRTSYDVASTAAAADARPGPVPGGTRTQQGGRLGVDVGPLWARGSYQRFGGEVPSRRMDLNIGAANDRWGGFRARYAQARWGGVGTSNLAGRGWLTIIDGLTLFGAWEAGDFGSRDAPVMDRVAPPLVSPGSITPGVAAITDRTTLRAGASLSRWGATIAGASLYAESDVALPLGMELDLGAPAVPGVERTGLEGMTIVPIPGLPGWTLEGSYQRWHQDGPYLPKEIYRGSFEYYGLFKETGNLEVWASIGVRGHDPMQTFVADDGTGVGGLTLVPFYQSWYGRIQVRVVTVRLYLGWDNFTLRRNNQNYPDRLQPFARTFFALRWDMWN